MIEARFTKKDKKIVSFEISGHAKSGAYGHDIVCAAVSVLSITTVNNIERMTKAAPISEMAEGFLSMEIQENLSTEQEEITQLLLTNFEFAMKDVESEYGKYLKIF